MIADQKFGLLRSKRGMTLLESTFGLAIMGMLSIVVVSFGQGRINTARVESTFKTLNSIAIASQQYKALNGVWPNSIDDLKPNLVSPNVSLNLFGDPYDFELTGKNFTVSTRVPNNVSDLSKYGNQVVIINEGNFKKASVSITERLEKLGYIKYGL